MLSKDTRVCALSTIPYDALYFMCTSCTISSRKMRNLYGKMANYDSIISPLLRWYRSKSTVQMAQMGRARQGAIEMMFSSREALCKMNGNLAWIRLTGHFLIGRCLPLVIGDSFLNDNITCPGGFICFHIQPIGDDIARRLVLRS